MSQAEQINTESPALPTSWAEPGIENYQLLRLPPLPTDRSTGARPLRFAQFGFLERHSHEQSLLRLSVQVPGQIARKGVNLLEVWVDHRNKEVRFNQDGEFTFEPLNHGLGRFMFAQGIAWAKRSWAHYRVQGGSLSSKDLANGDARQRRDHFLRAQGFDVVYEDSRLLKAHYSAARVSELFDDWNKEKVQILPLLEAAAILEQAQHNLTVQGNEIRRLEQRIETLRRDDSSLRFTIACLTIFSIFQAGLLIWITTN